MSGTSSTTPPLDGSDTSLTPEQRKAYAEIVAALAGGLPQRLTCPMCDFVFMRKASEYVCEPCRTFYARKEQPK